jgi:hypothetical protein
MMSQYKISISSVFGVSSFVLALVLLLHDCFEVLILSDGFGLAMFPFWQKSSIYKPHSVFLTFSMRE